MKISSTTIDGVFLIECFNAKDPRGTFVKTFHEPTFKAHGLATDFQESFFSVNKAGVIRGMHFQLPPEDHAKLVFCNHGALTDVVVDIRKNSPTYGKAASFDLNDENKHALYIPTGMAHGFETLKDQTIMTYFTTTPHRSEHDAGILSTSIDYKWKNESPIISDPDLAFSSIQDFKSPF